jgi:hypothetical protein
MIICTYHGRYERNIPWVIILVCEIALGVMKLLRNRAILSSNGVVNAVGCGIIEEER